MKDYIDNDFVSIKASLYNLYAVINHMGDFDFGHYYSYIKFSDKNCWYEFNDTNISKIGVNLLEIKNAYILIYIKNI